VNAPPAGVFRAARRLGLPVGDPPTLTVVIDTEEEFDWSAPFDEAATATENIRHQTLAQAVFDRHGVVPTYVIDYPVAASEAARAVLRGFAEAGRCEIGAHLHPWVNPPAGAPVDRFHSYPGNLPPALEREKIAQLTERIEAGFGQPPLIYKAGRYGIGPATDGILARLGYRIDVSVVPHSDFSADAGPDFTALPAGPFVTAAGVTALPLSVHFTGALARLGPCLYPPLNARWGRTLRLSGIAARAGLLERLRLSPEDHGLADMMRQTRAALAAGERLFMLTYHSSSLLPGAAPYVRSAADRERFLAALDGYLAFFLGQCGGRAASVSAAAARLRS
jgi:hypothetical protein